MVTRQLGAFISLLSPPGGFYAHPGKLGFAGGETEAQWVGGRPGLVLGVLRSEPGAFRDCCDPPTGGCSWGVGSPPRKK